jgi:hypothetical protein
MHSHHDCPFCSGHHSNEGTEKSEFCCCGEDDCSHHADESFENILGINDCCDEDFAHSCSFYSKIHTVNHSCIKLLNKDEEIKSDSLILNGTVDSSQKDDANVSGGYFEPLDLCTNLTDSAYGRFLELSDISLDIDSLHSQDLDIKDYNLEYYMFTNPDIIIERANAVILAKANPLTFNGSINHCSRDATTHQINFNNSFSADCQIHGPLAVKLITDDNCAPLNNVTFLHKTLSLNEIYYFYIGDCRLFSGQSPINLSGDECAAAVVFVLEDLKNV